MFIKPIFYFAVRISLFVSWITENRNKYFIGVNTEYRANLVNVPVTLLHMYWVSQFNPFFI